MADFLKKYRKKPKEKEIIISIFEKIKKEEKIDDLLINEAIKTRLFDRFIKLRLNGFYKKVSQKVKPIRNKFFVLKEYLNNVKYSDFFNDMNVTKLYANLGDDYNDLILRWLNDFYLINDDYVIDNNFYFNQNKILLNEINASFKKYPYNLDNVKNKLISIQNSNFDFKFKDDNIKNTPNSTIAEYFVNLYFAITNNIEPKDFQKYSRTKLKSNTLYPYSHAPGKGPDMFLLENENEKLKIIETTIHNTVKQIKNNEIFNIIDHVKLNEIKYINNDLKNKIKATEIVLVTPLNDFNELEEIEKTLKLNFNNTNNCGNEKKSKVTNFIKILDYRQFK